MDYWTQFQNYVLEDKEYKASNSGYICQLFQGYFAAATETILLHTFNTPTITIVITPGILKSCYSTASILHQSLWYNL